MDRKINLFPLQLFEFHSSKRMSETLALEILKEPSQKNDLNKILGNGRAHKRTTSNIKKNAYEFFDAEMFEWFNQCLDTVKNEMFIPEISLPITECWGTRTDRFEKMHQHSHPNSLMSGIWYLSDHPKSTTNFYYDNPNNVTGRILDIYQPEKKILKESITPEVGKLIIFPSSLYHDVSPNTTSTPRVTIAFNTFASGDFGIPSTHLRLRIE